jgi:hypothetical protein
MVPTSVFPNLERLYTKLVVVCVKEAWKFGFGWSANVYSQLSVISQIRNFKEQSFTKVSLTLRHEKTKTEFQTDFQISELGFCRPIRKKKRTSFIYVCETT